MVVEGDTGLSVEDGGVVVAVQIAGDEVVLGVGENALEGTVGGLLDGGLDLVVGDRLLGAAGQVDNGDVGGRNTHGHAGELAVEGRNDLADSLGSTSGGGDDVLRSSAATTPVLRGGTVDGLLGSSVGVDGGHETLNETELIVDDLGERSQAVGGARGVGDDGDVALVGLLVDTHNEHGGIGGRSRDDDLLGATLQVSGGLLGGSEDTGGLDDVVGTGLGPGDGSGVALSVELDDLAVDLEATLDNLDVALELTVGRVILEHVGLRDSSQLLTSPTGGNIAKRGFVFTYSVLRLNERVVDSDNVDSAVLNTVMRIASLARCPRAGYFFLATGTEVVLTRCGRPGQGVSQQIVINFCS